MRSTHSGGCGIRGTAKSRVTKGWHRPASKCCTVISSEQSRESGSRSLILIAALSDNQHLPKRQETTGARLATFSDRRRRSATRRVRSSYATKQSLDWYLNLMSNTSAGEQTNLKARRLQGSGPEASFRIPPLPLESTSKTCCKRHTSLPKVRSKGDHSLHRPNEIMPN